MFSASELLELRAQFPILESTVHGKTLVYLDNAASTHKPDRVLESMNAYYRTTHSNVHRGVHQLSQKATEAFEQAREEVRLHLNASDASEIIFTKGCTDAINTVASGYAELLRAGDEVLVSTLEHHSNIVPWQMACRRSGAVLRVIPINDSGELLWDVALLSPRTRLVAVNHISNALGTINPIEQIVRDCHAQHTAVLVDGAQSGPHLSIDVQALDVDFYTLSGHKIYGPTGIGVLYGKRALLDALPPYQGGGDMIKTVRFEETTYADPPFKFEAGTPNMAGAIGLAEALRFVRDVGLKRIQEHETALLTQASAELAGMSELRLVGTAQRKASVLSFLIEGAHPYDIGVLLDHMGIAVRTGHHCTQPLMERLGIPGTARASFALYNTPVEVEAFVQAVRKATSMLYEPTQA
ncbi:SufS family cysteine desulfurase [bacterium]|nr:SufS family cysteine desulfurase [bacterium]